MAIEFHCVNCQSLVRTPDATAGKKGRCPCCQAVVQIPLESLPADVTSQASGRSPDASPASRPVAEEPTVGDIEFLCFGCRQPVRVPAAFAGKKGKCPGCGAVVAIPRESQDIHPGSEPAPATTPAPQPERIEFQCGNCQRLVRTPLATAGKKGKCPHCEAVLHIPDPHHAAAGPGLDQSPAADGLVPIDETADPVELGELDLAPVAGPEPTSSDDATGMAAGGTTRPLPETDSPMTGGRPSVASPGDARWSGDGASSAGRTTRIVRRGTAKRIGLPWDRRNYPGFKYWATFRDVLFQPWVAFAKMKRGEILPAISYIAFAWILVALITALLQAGFGLFGAIQSRPPEAPATYLLGAIFAAVMFFVVVFLVSYVAGTIGSIIATFVAAGAVHGLLAVFGGANHSFDTTFRVVGYCNGSFCLVAWIPCLNVVLGIWYLVALSSGLMYAQETSGGKAAAAVLVPHLICCSVVSIPAMLVLPGMVDTMRQMAA